MLSSTSVDRAFLGTALHAPVRGKLEALFRLKLGDDIVIVGIEPLGHLHCGDCARLILIVLHTTSHRKISAEINHRAVPLIAFGDRSDQRDGIENVIVERKVVGWNMGQARALLQLPVLLTQAGSLSEHLSLTELA